MNNLTPEEQRLIRGDLKPQERKNLRKSDEWESCFRSWLDSNQPSEILKSLNQKEDLLKMLDGKTIQFFLLRIQMDEVEAMQQLFPYPSNWEEMEEEEMPDDLQEKAEQFLSKVQGNN
jgi:hypothetical protein